MDIKDCAKARRQRVGLADNAMAQAGQLMWELGPSRSTSAKRARARKAAMLYSRAAKQYTRAGLGLSAIGAWKKASSAYSLAGDSTKAKECFEESTDIDSHWEGDA